jgi:hypothetical protein
MVNSVVLFEVRAEFVSIIQRSFGFKGLSWQSFGMLRRVVWCKMTNVLEVFSASIIRANIALIMEAVCTCETWISLHQTIQRDIPEDKSFLEHNKN